MSERPLNFETFVGDAGDAFVDVVDSHQQVRLGNRKLVQRWSQVWNQLGAYVCTLQLHSIDKPNEDLTAKTLKKMEEHLRCSYRSVACVFLWYLFTGIYCWDRHGDSGLPPGKAVLLCLEHCRGWTGIWEGQNSWELSAMTGRGGLPQIWGSTPGSHRRSRRSESHI